MDYFSFEIDGTKVGYYEESDDGSVYYCNALLVMEGQKFENPFWVKYEDDAIIAYKYGDVDYIAYDQPEGVYPTAALNFLAKKMGDADTFEYTRFHEGKGVVLGPAKLVKDGHRIVEMVDGLPSRYLVIEDGIVTEYGWGGTAKSVKVKNRQEALRNTAFE